MLVKGDSLPWPGSSLWPLKHRGLPCPARELSSLYLTLSGEYLYVCMTDLPLMWPLAQSPTEASPCCSYDSSTYARNFRIGMCCFMQIRCYSGLCPHPYIAPHSEIKLCCLTETFTQKGISSVSPVVQSSLSRLLSLSSWTGGQWTMKKKRAPQKFVTGAGVWSFDAQERPSVIHSYPPVFECICTTLSNLSKSRILVCHLDENGQSTLNWKPALPPPSKLWEALPGVAPHPRTSRLWVFSK